MRGVVEGLRRVGVQELVIFGIGLNGTLGELEVIVSILKLVRLARFVR